jgi:hypothetical protein
MTTTAHHRLARTAAGALAATAILAPAASAGLPLEERRTPTVAYQATPAPDRVDSGRSAPVTPAAVQPPPAVAETVDDGFDWGSAAIGAAGVGIVALLAAAGASAAGHRRHGMRHAAP